MTSTVSSADTAPSNSLDLTFPAGFGLSDVTVAASNSLQISDRVFLFGIGGSSPGVATNSGLGTLTLGNDTKVGALTSVGNIQLGDRVYTSSVTSAGSVKPGNQDRGPTPTQHATLTPLVHRALDTFVPSGALSSVDVETGSANPVPGGYDKIVVKSGASLTLSSGNYIVNSLDIEPQATVNLDTSNGTIRLYVAKSWIWHAGVTVGDGSRFLVAYLGSSTMSLEAPFRATVLAPAATLNLATVNGGYQGVYYGKDVIIQPGVTVAALPTPLLIDSLTVSSTVLCPGQAAEVTLKTAAGAAVTPWINGVVGNSQFVQFGGLPGTRSVVATAYTADGRADVAQVPVTIMQCAAPPVPPVALHFWGARGRPGLVDLSTSTYDASGAPIPSTGAATYAWTFGDGQTATTTVPVVEHDYSAAINHLAPYSYFQASVTVTTVAGSASAQKVVSIWSLYAANRAKGIVQPPSTFSATPSSFSLTVTNYEPTPLSITQAKTDLVPCDPGLDAQLQPLQTLSATIPANATATVAIAAPPVTPSICELGLHLFGSTAAGAVRTDAYVRVGKHNPLTRQLITDSTTIALLNQASTLAADPNRFDENELRALVNSGALPNLPSPVPPGSVYSGVGDECNPEDTPPTGTVCQPTTDWVVEPPEMLNAFAGNFIMDHGCGNIGQLLRAVGQLYSHDSIMVKNRVEVRHSTASGDRVTADVDGIPFGVKLHPDTLQFLFPGTEGTATNPLAGTEGTHSIDEMTHAYSVTDPEGRTWRMGNEYQPSEDNSCSGDITAVPPLVIRPDPACSPQLLSGVVQQALNTESHYRFYMYSHADMPQSCTVPWCSGQPSTVCSLFARNSAASATPRLPLWPNGPIPNPPPSIDGMRPYSTDTRSAAAWAYFYQIHDQVVGLEHPFDTIAHLIPGLVGVVLSTAMEGAANRVGNQMVNCFASDRCDDTGSTWRDQGVGAGIAVSPDDMIQWDSCNPLPGKTPGTYGYNEPAVYLAAVFRHKYTLSPAAGTGTLTVIVQDDSSPAKGIPGATVILDSVVQGTTGSDGSLQVQAVTAGGHVVEAQQYTGPALTPLLLSPTPDQIVAMPACPAFPSCQASICPNGWTTSTTYATAAGTLSDGTPETSYLYACYPSDPPPPSCDLLTATAAPPQTNVTSGNATTVVLTLCEGATCSNGVRASCQQNCLSNRDCDNNLVCGNQGKCIVPPRLVHITDPGITGLVSDGCHCDPPNAGGNLDVTCDPNAQTNLTDWLCGQNALNFCSTPIVGGVANQTILLNGNGDCNTLGFHFVCTMDPLGSGGIIVGTDMRLLDGCGSGASDEKDAVQWLTTLAPATAQIPLPAPAVCTEFGPTAAPDNSWSCTGASASCYHNGIFACGGCCDNNAEVGPGVTYASVPR